MVFFNDCLCLVYEALLDTFSIAGDPVSNTYQYQE